jgi:hypothetical protein
MKKFWKSTGKFFLSIAALIVYVGFASFGGIAVEEVPESIKNRR